jgi:hypothetical protein
MQVKSKSAALAAAVLWGALLTTSVSASTEADQQFSALQGVEAQTLSATEMDGIHGAIITATEQKLLDGLTAAVTTLAGKISVNNPKLGAAILTRWNTVTLPRLRTFLDRT